MIRGRKRKIHFGDLQHFEYLALKELKRIGLLFRKLKIINTILTVSFI